MLVERLQALGAEVSTRPATPSVGDNIVATLQGKGSKNFLLMIHYDTVFAEGSAAERPFRMDGQRAYGPGVADAKGGVAMILHALAAARPAVRRLRHDYRAVQSGRGDGLGGLEGTDRRTRPQA